MLKKLHITNFALIDQLVFEPYKGFSVITGETGAGKSIMLGALGLLLGKRSDGTDLFNADQKCVLEGTFDARRPAIQHFLKVNDFDVEKEVIVRREILPSGKSRSFINDTPAKLSHLNELGEQVINIHSQHGNLELKNAKFILSLIDSFAGISNEVEAFQRNFVAYKSLQSKIKQLEEEQSKNLLDQDYFQFLFDELQEFAPREGEMDELENELGQLQHAEEIETSLNQSYTALEDEGGAVISNLLKTEQLLTSIKDYSKEINSLYQRIKESRIELEDLHSEISLVQSNIEYDAEKIENHTSRLNQLNQLLHKHHLSSDKDLLDKMTDLEDKLSSITSNDQLIEEEQSKLSKLQDEMIKSASAISQSRLQTASKLASTIEENLHALGIKNGQIQFDIQHLEEFNQHGIDEVKMLFSANAGKAPKDVNKVASGGELSRIMLTVKSILAKKEHLPSIIFDEIDAGVSGDVANKMAEIMSDMAKSMQVISITHLPQIAAKGAEHYTVSKITEQDRTSSNIRKVRGEERVIELAKMLSGENISTVAKENARILLDN